MKKSTVVVSITYAGILVRVVKYQGIEHVLLKTVSDAAGVLWNNQRRKVLDSQWLRRRLGVIEADLLAVDENSGGDIPPSNSESGTDISSSNGDSGTDTLTSNGSAGLPIYIRLDRVAAFLQTINPDKVRAAGNVSSAEHLESKISEWDDALHDYEELGFAVNLNHVRNQEATGRQCMRVASLLKIKAQLPDQKERCLMDALIAKSANGLGIPYQPDLIDGQQRST